MLKVFIGADPRQVVSLTTLIHSITKNAKTPVSITPLVLETLPIKRQGLTPFTYSRFLVPYLCGYEGQGLFLDADMLCFGDITEVFEIGRSGKAVHVMQEQPAFEWASMILFNCGHPANRMLTPEHIDNPEVKNLHKIGWLERDQIGTLPKEWNVCIPYTSNPPENPKLVHFTQGVPYWWETKNQPHAEAWAAMAQEASTASFKWVELMGRSVHADGVISRLISTGEVKSVEDYMERAGLTQAARALGLSAPQALWTVQLPLAMPMLWAGVKTAAVINVGTATVAAFIGAGGLGERIVAGLAVNDGATLLAGAVPAAVLALAVQWGFDTAERLWGRGRPRPAPPD